jgi:chromosome segregation ATPase
MSDDTSSTTESATKTSSRPTPAGVGVPGSPKPQPVAKPSEDTAKNSRPLKASGLSESIPPRPPAGDSNTAQAFSEARTQLDKLFGEQNQRVLELKIQATQGLESALGRLEDECRRTRTIMERNEALAREAERLFAEGQTLETQQDELEAKAEKSAERNKALAERGNTLREERIRLTEEREQLEDAVAEESKDLAATRAEVDRLTQRKETLQEENTQLERIQTRLDENIARLERLRDEYMTAINRLKNSKEDLINISTDVKSETPAASTSSAPA